MRNSGLSHNGLVPGAHALNEPLINYTQKMEIQDLFVPEVVSFESHC